MKNWKTIIPNVTNKKITEVLIKFLSKFFFLLFSMSRNILNNNKTIDNSYVKTEIINKIIVKK